MLAGSERKRLGQVFYRLAIDFHLRSLRRDTNEPVSDQRAAHLREDDPQGFRYLGRQGGRRVQLQKSEDVDLCSRGVSDAQARPRAVLIRLHELFPGTRFGAAGFELQDCLVEQSNRVG